MKSKTVTGTAILTLEKMDSKFVPFSLDLEELTCSNSEADYISEDFGLLETDTLPCPDAAYDLDVGQSVTVAVEYEFFYSEDYYGEWDVDLEYKSQEVRKDVDA